MNDPDLREPAPAALPHQLWQPWTLIVPAILLIPMLSLASAWQISPSDDADLRQPVYHRPRGEEITNPAPPPEVTPEATPEPTPQATPLAMTPASSKFTMFVPGEDAKLHAKTFSTIGGSEADFVAAGTNSLKNLFPAAPEYFPAGTQLQSLSQDESDPSQVRVSLNEKFWNSDYWSGTSRTDAAMQAIAHTLQSAFQQSGGSGPLHIQLMRDNQEMDALGEYDVRVAYTPDDSMVADAPSKTAAVKQP